MIYIGNAQNSAGVMPLPNGAAYQGGKRNHLTAKLRQLYRRVKSWRLRDRVAVAVCLAPLLLLALQLVR